MAKDSGGRSWSEVKCYLILIIRRLCNARLVLIPYFLVTCITVSFNTSAPYLANFPRDWLILAWVLNRAGGIDRELGPPEIEGI